VIWHFLELWLLLFAAFALGTLLGVLAYAGLARTEMASLQEALADAVGDLIDDIKARFGAEPAWRTEVRRNARQMRAQAAPALRRIEPRAELASPARPPALPPPETPADWEEEERVEPAWDLGADTPVSSALDDLIDGRVATNGASVPLPKFDLPAMRPASLTAPRNGVPDNLQRIRGIGRRNEELLNSLGIFHFGQIAAWTPAEARWVAAFLAFPERIERDDWIGQATILASGGDTGYVKADRRRAMEEDSA
jgi:predicted flap endonuclease-1-like 5' DNA nuclease